MVPQQRRTLPYHQEMGHGIDHPEKTFVVGPSHVGEDGPLSTLVSRSFARARVLQSQDEANLLFISML